MKVIIKMGCGELYADLSNCRPQGNTAAECPTNTTQHVISSKYLIVYVEFHYVNFKALLYLPRSHWFEKNQKRKQESILRNSKKG